MLAVRYVLPAVLVVLGIVLLPLNPDGLGPELFSMLVGAGISVYLINFLFRWGAKGDLERQQEDEAREFFARHGHWPDEPPPAGRR
ncbi:MAG TPA: hypothetical protein VM266_08055 [Solirubrobacteraceae bacterium]|nr:hypothetical protein [Solirubrobacteraceae bacterium]